MADLTYAFKQTTKQIQRIFSKYIITQQLLQDTQILFMITQYLNIYELISFLSLCSSTRKLLQIPYVQIRILRFKLQKFTTKEQKQEDNNSSGQQTYNLQMKNQFKFLKTKKQKANIFSNYQNAKKLYSEHVKGKYLHKPQLPIKPLPKQSKLQPNLQDKKIEKKKVNYHKRFQEQLQKIKIKKLRMEMEKIKKNKNFMEPQMLVLKPGQKLYVQIQNTDTPFQKLKKILFGYD